MEMNKEILEKVKLTFTLGDLRNKNICLIHDTDADGLSSAYLITKALEWIEAKVKLEITEVSRALFLSPANIQLIQDNNIEYIFCVDIPLEGSNLMAQYRELTAKGIHFVIFDHHEYTKELENSIYIHPMNLIGKEQPAYCTAKLVYDTVGKFIDLSKYDWVKAIGMTADLSFLEYAEEVQALHKKYEGKEVEIKNADDYFKKTKIGECTIKVDLARSMGESRYVYDMFDLFIQAETPEQLIELIGTSEAITEASETVDYYVNNYESLAEKTGDIYWIEIKSKYRLNSPISTTISQKIPNNTLITFQRLGDFYGLSARRQDQVYSMRDLLSRCTEGLKDANGGGHIPASGGRVRVEDFKEFKERVLKNYETFKIK